MDDMGLYTKTLKAFEHYKIEDSDSDAGFKEDKSRAKE